MTYLSDGNIEIESNNVTVFDLWSMSAYLKMRADELYINVKVQQDTRDAAKRGLVTATQMPRQAGKVTPIRQS